MRADRDPAAESTPFDLGFDPGDMDFVANPYPAYGRLRALAPIVYDEATDHWLATRFDDVRSLLRDRRFGRTYLHLATHEDMGHKPPPASRDAFWHLINHGILDMEPPDHTRVRRLVSKAFTPRMVESMREPVQQLTDDLVDHVTVGAEFDLLSTIAEPLPVAVIAELLGVPRADRHLLRPWSADICRMYELHPTEHDAALAVAASDEIARGLAATLARQLAQVPRELDISEMALVVDEDERLTEDELIGTCALLLNAGHEATVNVTGNGWWALFRNPEAHDQLRAHRELVPAAVEELMRWDTPLQLFERWVLEDVEIHGVRVPRGAELGLVFGSANRDPSAFDHPDELRLDRDPNPQLTFGAGNTLLPGAPLARLELQTSFATVLRRLPNLEFVDEPRWKPGYIIRGLESLCVRA